jgi:hypothetical protein
VAAEEAATLAAANAAAAAPAASEPAAETKARRSLLDFSQKAATLRADFEAAMPKKKAKTDPVLVSPCTIKPGLLATSYVSLRMSNL